MMNNESGVVRIKNGDWSALTKLAVNVSVRIQKPVNQATILHAIMKERLGDVTTSEAVEMVLSLLEDK